MASGQRTVLVLGAGFTRAFLPKAPLLVDYYEEDILASKFKEFPHASRILVEERKKNPDGQISLERLMTRLDGGMPYDFEQGADDELGLLLSELKRCFERRLDRAKKEGQIHGKELGAFARHCAENAITCITFNYDDVLDQALWEATEGWIHPSRVHWHPDGGYGFFCRPSDLCIRDAPVFMDQTSMLLLKLHGSVNWRIRRGYSRPYVVDAVMHHETWFHLPVNGFSGVNREAVELHLEPMPFIVPPVLAKSTLVEQPILRLIWSLAYRELEKAERVVFVGYSFPVTDIAAGFLFGEALRNLPASRLSVVNWALDEPAKRELRDAYRRCLPGITNEQFDFRGALQWSQEWCSQAPAMERGDTGSKTI